MAQSRAAKTEHAFEFTNRLDREMHIAGVRVTCGCTTPIVEQNTIRPGEKGAVIAHLNTRTFNGKVGSTLTVTFDRPNYSEVQLRVDAYIRRDVVFDPGEVDFGSVDQGQAAEQTVDLQYAGRDDWQVVGIQSPGPYLTVEAQETRRSGGRVGYRLVVRLLPDAPAGYVDGELILQTNDRRLTSVPLAVSARITPALTVSPTLLRLGTVEVGARGPAGWSSADRRRSA